MCTLSNDNIPGKKVKKQVLPEEQAYGDHGKDVMREVLPGELDAGDKLNV